MISPVNNNLTGLVFESKSDKIDLEQSLAKLSSGNKLIRAGDDTGAFSQASKLGSKNKRDLVSLQNLQNLVSYSQIQDGTLESVGKILNRMGEITVRALDVISTDADRENFNKEFLELADQLDKLKNEDFNGLELFGSGSFSQDKKDFIDSLKNNWLKASEDLINQQYGWDTVPTDNWDLIVNENDTGGYAAFVRFSYGGDNKGDVIEMQFDLPDFSAPHTQPTSTADRVVAHEMVHLLQAQNNYIGDLVGDGTSTASWFMEGLAEFIHGADDRVLGHLGTTPTDSEISALTAKIGTGNEAWTASDQYAAAYLATRYLDNAIANAGLSASNGNAGIGHMTEWMKAKHDLNSGSTNSGINAYLTAHGAVGFADNNSFITDFKGAGGLNYIKTSIVPNINNTDLGSVRGSDATGSGTSFNAKTTIPDATGAPLGSYIEEQDNSSLAATIDGTGLSYDLKSVNTIFVNTDTYNLKSITNAKSTLNQLSSWIENLASERSNVGANLSRLEKEIQNLNGKITTGEMAVSRIQDTDVATESTKFASSQVRMQASIAILAQAKDLNVGIRDLIRGIMIGQS